MKHVTRIAIASTAVLLGSFASIGAANASTGGGHGTSGTQQKTIERPAGSDAKYMGPAEGKKAKPGNPSNKYSQTIERPAGTDFVPGTSVK